MESRRCATLFLLWIVLATAPWIAARANPIAVLSAEDRDALGRIAYAEAGTQGEEGLAAVAHAVLNRVAAGRFGTGVQGVLDAPGQFEPVARAGGTWRRLPPLTESQRLVFDTILDLILQDRLPDLTGGSTYFQNPAIVAQRAAAGLVSPGLVNFGGQVPAAVVRDHSFYRAAGSLGPAPEPRRREPASDQPTAAFYRVVHGRLIQVGTILGVSNSADAASPSAKLVQVGAARAAARRVHILRGAGIPEAGPPPAS